MCAISREEIATRPATTSFSDGFSWKAQLFQRKGLARTSHHQITEILI
jgi:hypothetical protein